MHGAPPRGGAVRLGLLALVPAILSGRHSWRPHFVEGRHCWRSFVCTLLCPQPHCGCLLLVTHVVAGMSPCSLRCWPCPFGVTGYRPALWPARGERLAWPRRRTPSVLSCAAERSAERPVAPVHSQRAALRFTCQTSAPVMSGLPPYKRRPNTIGSSGTSAFSVRTPRWASASVKDAWGRSIQHLFSPHRVLGCAQPQWVM